MTHQQIEKANIAYDVTGYYWQSWRNVYNSEHIQTEHQGFYRFTLITEIPWFSRVTCTPQALLCLSGEFIDLTLSKSMMW